MHPSTLPYHCNIVLRYSTTGISPTFYINISEFVQLLSWRTCWTRRAREADLRFFVNLTPPSLRGRVGIHPATFLRLLLPCLVCCFDLTLPETFDFSTTTLSQNFAQPPITVLFPLLSRVHSSTLYLSHLSVAALDKSLSMIVYGTGKRLPVGVEIGILNHSHSQL